MNEVFAQLSTASELTDMPVLFQSAGAWVKKALSDAGVLITEDTHQQCATMIVGGLCPELSAQDYLKLMDMQQATGSEIALFIGKNPNGTHAIKRDVLDNICDLSLCGDEYAYPIAYISQNVALKWNHQVDFWTALEAVLHDNHLVSCVLQQDIVIVQDAMGAYQAQCAMQRQINLGHIAAGVQIFALDGVYIAPDAKIAAGAVILPGTIIRAGCEIGSGATIGPNTVLEQAKIGAGTTINSSQVYESSIGDKVAVGPFAYVRPGCEIGNNARIGDFVELKKAKIGNGTKVSHLTYIGDATVGERVNFGCGTVVVNYDGYHKYQTNIGDDCFVGCNTNLVAPVSLGDRAFTAAGTTVTKDVPSGALAVARARQENLEGWNDKRRARMEKEKNNH